MSALQFPCKIFETQKKMDDKNAKDMKSGDLSEIDLKAKFHLTDISTSVNLYTLTEIPSYEHPMVQFFRPKKEVKKLTKWECARILFDEFRYLSRPFSRDGPYTSLIELMITHMQKCGGKSFCHPLLNSALKEQILSDRSEENSTRLRLKKVFDTNIDWDRKCYPAEQKKDLSDAIMNGRLPKFDRLRERMNGMGITVHDTWATHITIKSLTVDNEQYHAEVHYKIQDHFGLDDDDILKIKFKNIRLFRIWFVLQRYSEFAFKPFITNMEATIHIIGKRNGIKK
ncbi:MULTISPECIES: YPO3983 family protein [unclassified Cedecea]|uniref:YPO3983 family protein n=1 Tax=unclassified Cedecea TaxID=2649846 RepID=UPI003015A1A5